MKSEPLRLKRRSKPIQQNQNILKTRDDHVPVYFESKTDSVGKFTLTDDSECSWVGNSQTFGVKELRPRIEPWLTALFQSEHLSLLAGSGLTHAVHLLAAGKGAAGMNSVEFKDFQEQISTESTSSAKNAGRKNANFEDTLRVANELLRGLEVFTALQKDTDKKAPVAPKRITKLREEIREKLSDFAKSILVSESGIVNAQDDKREEAFNILINFLMSFASRTGTRDRLNIFTTNYDRVIEAGAELAGLHLLDRFLGNLMPIFRSSRLDLDMHYNPPGIRGEPRYLEGVTRFTKLHGSIDWVQAGKDIRRMGLPFGAESIEPYLRAPVLKDVSAHELMIYPNAAKDRETAVYPYVELFRDFAAAVCRPNSTLVAYGYSFGDEHINRVIEDMLTIPSTHLVVISYGDPQGRIMQTFKKVGRPSQISLMVGSHLGDLKILTENYMPKSAIDKATFRMSELLKQRFGAQQADNKGDAQTPFSTGGPEGGI